MNSLDYWKECISISADECELKLTNEQLKYVAESVENWHDNYGMAFYSPPPSDRISDIENEWKLKLSALQKEYDSYRNNSETAIKKALRQPSDSAISIGKYGEVTRYDGRTTVIQ